MTSNNEKKASRKMATYEEKRVGVFARSSQAKTAAAPSVAMTNIGWLVSVKLVL